MCLTPVGDISILAGMAIPLPYDLQLYEAITEPTARQIRLMWFAAIGLLIVAKVIQSVWNSLAADLPRLPRLSYLKSLGATALWGLAMFVALLLIAGTREALTPAAWVRDGWTYRLADEQGEELTRYREERREELRSLYARLKAHADEHDGRWPDAFEELPDGTGIAVPGTPGLVYVYTPEDDAPQLAIEPQFDSVRYALTRAGEVVER